MSHQNSERIYVGRGKRFGIFGQISFTINLETVSCHAFEYEGKTYVKLILSEMRQPDKFGKTHSVQVDTWKPNTTKENSPSDIQHTPSQHQDEINPEEIPF